MACCFLNFPRYLVSTRQVFDFPIFCATYYPVGRVADLGEPDQWEPGTFRHWLLRLERQTAFCEAERENGRSDQSTQNLWQFMLWP
jgi:hypothetical protein